MVLAHWRPYREGGHSFTEKEIRRNNMTIDISKFWLGMNNDWLLQNTDTSYPRYNIVENVDTGNYRIEVAIPGWSKEEIEVVHI